MALSEFSWRLVDSMTFEELSDECWELEKRLAAVKRVLQPMQGARADAAVIKMLEEENRARENLHTNE